MTQSTSNLFARYQAWRRFAEPGFWILLYCAQASANAWIAWVNIQHLGLANVYFKPWQPLVWHACGNITLFALLPAVIAFERRFPLRWELLRRNLPFHFLASIVYCVVHFLATWGLIKLVYLSQGDSLPAPSLPAKIFFQYLKDVRYYFFAILILNFYRLLMMRWQGEASLLDAPEDEPPDDSVEHPEQFLVRKLGKEFLLPAADIEWVQACGNYVNLRVRGRDYPLRSTMAAIEARLDPKRFIRVHRSYISNLDHVRQLEPLDSGDARVNMTDGSQVPVSRRYLDALRNAAQA